MSRDHERTASDPEIQEYYAREPEETRLEQGPFQLERARTLELIRRHAPSPPAQIVDVGGAAGVYAFGLAAQGYEVHLVDASERLVLEARRRNAAMNLASCEVGDARSTPFPDSSADIVLLLGPLYHLPSADDRARALAEASRVLTRGGLLFAAAISRWASALDGLARDLFQDAAFAAIVEEDLRTGQHRNPTDRLDYFTTAYFHRAEDFQAEISGSGLFVEGLFGIEGPGWMLPDVEARVNDPARRADLLRVAGLFESDPAVLAMSAHLLLVARKSL